MNCVKFANNHSARLTAGTRRLSNHLTTASRSPWRSTAFKQPSCIAIKTRSENCVARRSHCSFPSLDAPHPKQTCLFGLYLSKQGHHNLDRRVVHSSAAVSENSTTPIANRPAFIARERIKHLKVVACPALAQVCSAHYHSDS